MKISQLSQAAAVSPATVKYYTREGLVPAGKRTGYNQTEYDDGHVARLRLIRALIEVGALSVATTRDILKAIDDPQLPLGALLGEAQKAGTPQRQGNPSDRSMERVTSVMQERGWKAHPGNPGIQLAAGVLDAYDSIGRPDLADTLPRYAEAADIVAEADLDAVERSGDRDRMAEAVIVGTALGDTLLAGLRRIAQESQSVRRYPHAARSSQEREAQ
ncbi:MerR family transcriptional regulator [Ruicaihuangia caeni]|uniref:MerR family transcriptional regulator n=1 Tax=Ruicaihuangia caeni TaxID=3042517 RepID=UPI0033903949